MKSLYPPARLENAARDSRATPSLRPLPTANAPPPDPPPGTDPRPLPEALDGVARSDSHGDEVLRGLSGRDARERDSGVKSHGV